MPDPSAPGRDAPARVVFPSVASVREADALRTEILGRLARGITVELDLSRVEETDVSLVQLLLSADLSAAKASASLSLARPLPEAIRRTLRRCGFADALVGPLDPNANIWTRES